MALLVYAVCSLAIFVKGDVDLASPEVFNPYFYIDNNVEVLHAHVHDVNSAKQHWLHHGIDMGLQASGNFHSVQYIKRYPDLMSAFGPNNYREAIHHFLTMGSSQEHRLGYLEGGYGGRWTVSDSQHRLFISASRRMGAAIDSLVWDNHEFLNAWDHGRELQMALTFPPNGECLNPTEAGGRFSGQRNTTYTQIQHVHAAGNNLNTTALPEYWLRPGSHTVIRSGSNCEVGMPALNTENTYPHPFSKNVTLGCHGVTQPCILYKSSFTIGGDIPHYTVVQMEAPTGYLAGDFRVVRSFDQQSGHLVDYTNKKPIVFSTADEQHAMGVYAPPNQRDADFMYYGKGLFPNGNIAAATNKWTVVVHKNAFPAGSTHVLNYDAYLCVGTTNDVIACLKKLTSDDAHLIG